MQHEIEYIRYVFLTPKSCSPGGVAVFLVACGVVEAKKPRLFGICIS